MEKGVSASVRHRDRLDIIADILNEAVGGCRKTHIMYKCNLSCGQLTVYLKFMLDKDLLRSFVEKSSREVRVFEATDKGQTFLRAYRSLRTLLSV